MRQFNGNENEVYDLLDDVVIEFTNGAKAFTAYDVTVEARKRTDVEFFHRDVAKHIHSAVRHIAPHYGVRNHSAYQAREYYDTGVTAPAIAHGHPRLKPSVGKSLTAAVVNAGNAIKAFGQAAVGNAISTTATPRSEGRVLIPASLMRFIGARHGTMVFVSSKPGELTIFPPKPSGVANKNTKSYIADKYVNIRLTKRTLKQAGLENKDVVLVAHPDRIVVTEK